MAHCDSVAPAPGATDDGSGVVTLLETLRALRSGTPPRNDLVIVFTDGEELGTVGVQGFVDEHPWAKQDASQSIPNLLIRGMRFYVEYGLRRQDHAAEARPALGGSFLNKRLLNRVRLFRRAKPSCVVTSS
jgi:acetylornithine deacetylase/succinyl-diaminopimelate desuccinylase-like protein